MAIKAVSLDGLRYFLSKIKLVFAPKGHASSGTEYGAASTSAYGHAKIGTAAPKAPAAAASTGSSSAFAREDHVHPKQAMDKATSSALGVVKPDGATTTVDGDGVIRAVQPSEKTMFLAAHKVGSYLETSGTNPTEWGGTWQQEPSLGPFTWLRTK